MKNLILILLISLSLTTQAAYYEYYSNGKIFKVIHTDRIVTYYWTGELLSVVSTKGDMVWHGTRIVFYKNGQTEAIHQYKDGVKDGPYSKYNFQGILTERGIYLNGSRIHKEPDD